MQTRKAERVLPLPVGAEISVASPARMLGQPCSCGSVGLPNLLRNHSAVTGCAQASEVGISSSMDLIVTRNFSFFVRYRSKSAGQLVSKSAI